MSDRHPLARRVGGPLRRLARDGFAATIGRATVHRRLPPDFLIVGAQRCGTTSLHRALQDHPGFLPPLLGYKGVHWFDTGWHRPRSWYLAQFPTATVRQRHEHATGVPAFTGESSPYYLFHPAAPARIAEHLPATRLVVMLRDPISRAFSHYHHMVWEGHEDAATFEEAIDREPERVAGEEERLLREPAARSHAHQHQAYLARGCYAVQLGRLFDAVGRERVLVFHSGDFFADPTTATNRVLAFLERPPMPGEVAMIPHNKGTYEPMEAPTRARLREWFRPHDEQLWSLLGEQWW